jgi:hypothetical protein
MDRTTFDNTLQPVAEGWPAFDALITLADELVRRTPNEVIFWQFDSRRSQMLLGMFTAIIHIADADVLSLLERFPTSSIAQLVAARDGYLQAGAPRHSEALAEVIRVVSSELQPATSTLSEPFDPKLFPTYKAAADEIYTTKFFRAHRDTFRACNELFSTAANDLPAVVLNWIRQNRVEFEKVFVTDDSERVSLH